MTERPRAPRRPSPGWVLCGALAAFVAAFGLLSAQVRAGRDPLLGAGTPVAAAPERPRVIVVRRIVRTTVITHVHRARPAAPAGSSAPAAPPVSSAPAAPAASAAPATAAPAPAPVAAPSAPAPAPAPVTTQAS